MLHMDISLIDMKQRYIIVFVFKSIKHVLLKIPKHKTCVYCALEHINHLIFTHGSKTQTKLGYLSLLDDLHLQIDSIQNSVIHELDSNECYV